MSKKIRLKVKAEHVGLVLAERIAEQESLSLVRPEKQEIILAVDEKTRSFIIEFKVKNKSKNQCITSEPMSLEKMLSEVFGKADCESCHGKETCPDSKA